MANKTTMSMNKEEKNSIVHCVTIDAPLFR